MTAIRRRYSELYFLLLIVVLGLVAPSCHCFTVPNIHHSNERITGVTLQEQHNSSEETSSSNELIARRITVVGDVGGYYRACVINEVRGKVSF
jgi:hypothetical protein